MSTLEEAETDHVRAESLAVREKFLSRNRRIDNNYISLARISASLQRPSETTDQSGAEEEEVAALLLPPPLPLPEPVAVPPHDNHEKDMSVLKSKLQRVRAKAKASEARLMKMFTQQQLKHQQDIDAMKIEFQTRLDSMQAKQDVQHEQLMAASERVAEESRLLRNQLATARDELVRTEESLLQKAATVTSAVDDRLTAYKSKYRHLQEACVESEQELAQLREKLVETSEKLRKERRCYLQKKQEACRLHEREESEEEKTPVASSSSSQETPEPPDEYSFVLATVKANALAAYPTIKPDDKSQKPIPVPVFVLQQVASKKFHEIAMRHKLALLNMVLRLRHALPPTELECVISVLKLTHRFSSFPEMTTGIAVVGKSGLPPRLVCLGAIVKFMGSVEELNLIYEKKQAEINKFVTSIVKDVSDQCAGADTDPNASTQRFFAHCEHEIVEKVKQQEFSVF